jgi:molybdenum cofactor biosynthesis enzyme MoaA
VPHLQTAPLPDCFSFGQGCEGEPLLMWETIRKAILEIRKHTAAAASTSTPTAQTRCGKALCEAGLNSIRVSTNSARSEIYTPYYRPNNYVFEDIVKA